MNRGTAICRQVTIWTVTAAACAALALPTPARALGYNEVCGPAKNPNGLHGSKKANCDAAKQAQQASSSDDFMWKVWAGVAATCGVACAMSFTAAGSAAANMACSGAQVAGMVGDMAKTKDLAGSMASILGGGYTAYQTFNASVVGKDGAKGNSKAACLSAGMAALQSVTKKAAAGQQKDAVEQNLRDAEKYESQFAGVAPGYSGSGSGASTGGSAGGTKALTGRGAETTVSSLPPSCGSGTDFGGQLQCAVARDPSLGSILSHPKFGEEMKKNTGMNLDEFVNRSGDSPSVAMSSGMGLSGEKASNMAALLGKAEVEAGTYNGDTNLAGYSGSGAGGGAQAGGSGDPNLGEMMAGLMSQLNPNAAGEGPPPGVSEVDFQALTRAPAVVAEDKNISIFNRVSFRYFYVGKRMHPVAGGAIR